MGDEMHAHKFDNQIMTTALSWSIMLERRDMVGKRIKERKPKEGSGQTHIGRVEDYTLLKDKRVVAIDPNMSDLLYYADSDTKEQTKFRYIPDTRHKEAKAKEKHDYLQWRKEEVVDGKRVVEWEAEPSAYNCRTTNFVKFQANIRKRMRLTLGSQCSTPSTSPTSSSWEAP